MARYVPRTMRAAALLCEACGRRGGGAMDREIGLFELSDSDLARMLARQGCPHVAPLLDDLEQQ
jgi:hypothetical protein